MKLKSEGGAGRATGTAEGISSVDIYALCLMAFVMDVGLSIVSPILPEIMRDFALSAWQVGMVVTVFGLARLVIDLPLGVLLDRIDSTRLLVTGSLLLMLGSLGSAIAFDYTWLLAARLVMGTGAAICSITALFAVSRSAGTESRGKVIGMYQSALLAGTAIGPAIGGLAASIAGWRTAFFICALMGAITLLVVTIAFGRKKLGTSPTSHKPEHSTEAPAEAGSQGRVPWNLVAIHFTTFVFRLSISGFRNSIAPLHGSNQLRIGTGTLGLMLGSTAIIRFLVTIGSGIASDRWGRKVILFPGVVLLAAGTMGFILATDELGFALSLIVLSLGGFGNSLPTTMLVDAVPAGRVGMAISVNRFVGDIAVVVAPVFLGWVLDTAGFATAAVFTAAILLSTMPGVALTVHEKQQIGKAGSVRTRTLH